MYVARVEDTVGILFLTYLYVQNITKKEWEYGECWKCYEHGEELKLSSKTISNTCSTYLNSVYFKLGVLQDKALFLH